MADLKAQFETAVAESKQLPEKPDNMTLLKIYALYKQATAGDVEGKRPGFTDMVGRSMRSHAVSTRDMRLLATAVIWASLLVCFFDVAPRAGLRPTRPPRGSRNLGRPGIPARHPGPASRPGIPARHPLSAVDDAG